jgi:endonuclease III
MKNSKDYSPRIEKLFKTLKKDAPAIAPVTYNEPIEAIVYAFISAFTTEANVGKIQKRITGHFVDINDLRVSRPEEIAEVFGDMSEPAIASAQAMTTVLNAIFEKFDRVSLAGLTDEGKRQARKDLQDIPGMTPFTVAYTFLTALDGHAIPLTDAMVSYLKQNEMVHPESTPQEIESFLERQISAADAYAFYALLRAEAEGSRMSSKAGKNAAPKKAAKVKTKQTVKKTSPKKKTGKK